MACASAIHRLSPAAWFMAAHHAVPAPPLDHVMLFGFLSVFAAGVCYLHRHDSRAAMLTFAASLAATGVYGFLEGAWPLGILETAWALGAARKGLQLQGKSFGRKRQPAFAPDLASRQSRYKEIYGLN
jgi:hypothetical protein